MLDFGGFSATFYTFKIWPIYEILKNLWEILLKPRVLGINSKRFCINFIIIYIKLKSTTPSISKSSLTFLSSIWLNFNWKLKNILFTILKNWKLHFKINYIYFWMIYIFINFFEYIIYIIFSQTCVKLTKKGYFKTEGIQSFKILKIFNDQLNTPQSTTDEFCKLFFLFWYLVFLFNYTYVVILIVFTSL